MFGDDTFTALSSPKVRVEVTVKHPMRPLGISSLKWTKKVAQGINEDRRTQLRYKPSLNTPLQLDDITAFFYYMYPEDWWELQLSHTNPKLQGHDSLNAKLTKGELIQFWGYCLALSIHTGVPLEKMWSDKPVVDALLPPPMLGRHGMIFNRFKKIRSVLSFGPDNEPALRQDNWAFVRPLVDMYNKHRAEYITPGWLLTVDETMFAWRGQVGLLNSQKCPHRSWVPRKPEPLGVELKTMGDALSGVMMRMEICEGRQAMAEKEYSEEWGATTACTLRLASPWFGSQRVLAADSWFSGLKTMYGLLLNGLHHIGDVKTNSSLFCKDSLIDATPQGSGSWATFSSALRVLDRTIPIYSVSHRRGESIHTFIASCGTTLQGASLKAYFEDDEERANGNLSDCYETARSAPRVLNDYTLAQPCLDRHNRYRQFILAMEKRLVTNSFNFRFGSSMHGVVFTDTFFAYRYFKDPDVDFKTVMGKLAYALMHNSFLNPATGNPTPQHPSPPTSGRGSPNGGDSGHELVPLKSVPSFNGHKQQRCIMCNTLTIWVCRSCTGGPLALVPICPEKTYVRRGENKGRWLKHGCLARHQDHPSLIPGSRKRKGAKRAREAATDGTESCEDECESCYE